MPTTIFPDWGELVEILGHVCAQTMPLRYGWGSISFQTASHIHVIQMQGVWAASIVVDGHLNAHSHHYPQKCFPRFERAGWSPSRCRWANDAPMLWLRLYIISNCILYPCHACTRCLSSFYCGRWHMDAHSHCFPHARIPRLGRADRNPKKCRWANLSVPYVVDNRFFLSTCYGSFIRAIGGMYAPLDQRCTPRMKRGTLCQVNLGKELQQ